MAITVGSVSVDVVPDLTRFNATMRDIGRNLSATVQVDADTTRARARIDELARGTSATINAQVDDAVAKSELAELARSRTSTFNAQVDDAVAKGELAELARSRTATINVDADTGAARTELAELGASAGSAGSGLSGMLTAAVMLGPALVPVGAAAVVAAGGLGTLGAAAVAAAGLTTMVFSGVGNAMKLMGQEQTQASAAGAAAGAAAAQHAQAVVAAQRQMQSAQMSLGDARRAAASQELQDSQAIASAQTALADARRNAASQQRADAQAVVSAQQALTQANDQVRLAQLALTAAQEAGRRELESFANNAADAALAQRQAAISLEEAQATAAKTMASSTATDLQKRQAALDVAKAQQSLTEANERVTESSQDNVKAQAAGVAGTQAVTSAQKQVTSAQDAQKQATQTLADAQRKASDDQVKSQEAISKAAQAVADAQRKASDDQVKSQESIVRAQQGVAAAMDAMKAAQQQAVGSANAGLEATRAKIAALDPATRGFADYLRGTWVPLWHDVQGAAAGGLLPGVQAGLEAIRPAMPGITGLVRTFAGALGDLFENAGKALASPFWQDFAKFATGQIVSGIKSLGDIVGYLARGFAGLWEAFAPLIGVFLGWLVQLAQRFADFGTNASSSAGFGKFVEYVKQAMPEVGHIVGGLLQFIWNVIQALAPIGLPIMHAIGGVIDALNQVPIPVLTGIAGGIMAIVAGLKIWSGLKSVASLIGTLTEVGPVGLILGIVAGLVYLLWANSKTFRDFVQNEVLPTLKQWGDWLRDHVLGPLRDLWGWIQDKVIPLLVGVFMDAWHGLKDAVKKVTDAFNDNKGELSELWDGFKKLIGWIIEHVLPLLGGVLKGAFEVLGGAISIVIGIVSTLIDMWNATWQLGKDIGHWFANDFVGFFVGAWNRVRDGVGGAIGAIVGAYEWLKTKASEAIGFMVYTVYDNGIRSFVNPIADFFGVHNLLPYISYNVSGIGSAPAGNAGAFQARAMADGGLVTGPGGPRDDRVPIMGSNGEFMVNAAATAKHLPLLLAINGGLGASGGTHFSLGGLIGGFASGLGSILSDPLGALTRAITGPANKLGDFAGMGHLMQSGVKAIGGWFANWVTSLFGSSGSGGGAVVGPPGGAVERWRGVVDQVLTLLHQPLSLDNGVLSLIRSESGGNPNAINLTDSNARAGHPSQGLMQTIPTTFRAYAGPYAGLGITNPLANIYAGVAYALANYGPGMLAGGGRHSGGRYIGYDSGGLVPPGHHMLYNGTGGDEVIAPQQTFQQVIDRMSPERAPAAMGPLMHVEHQHINDGVDMELALQQAEFRRRASVFS